MVMPPSSSRLLFRWPQVTSLERTWGVLVAIWAALLAAWQWPLFQVNHDAGLTTLLFFAVYLVVAVLAVGFFFAFKGGEPEKTVESKNIHRIPRLDHLRFFAAALVVLYHYFGKIVPVDVNGRNLLFNLMLEGRSGVDIFFVLSGFIFGMISYEKKIRYGDFIWSRVIRIYPLYLFAILLVLAVHPERFLPIDSVMLMFPVLIVGYLFALPGFTQLWTIGLEFQFYLIFPFLAAFLLRNGYRYLLGMLVLAIGIRALYFTELGTVKDVGYGTLLGRIDQFVIGIGAAWLFIKHRPFFSRPAHLAVAVLLAAASFQWLVDWDSLGAGANSPLWVVWPSIEGVIWGYLALSYVSCRIPLPAFLDESLAKLGAMSFSIYIMHDFAVVWALKHAKSLSITGSVNWDAALTGLFIALPLAVAIAWCTYNLVEKQFFIYRRKYVEPVGTQSQAQA
jgi:peptidoglycan/LPS O-acetylase OafA/YrhL